LVEISAVAFGGIFEPPNRQTFEIISTLLILIFWNHRVPCHEIKNPNFQIEQSRADDVVRVSVVTIAIMFFNH
jgi:hypothetical protein